MKTKNLLTLIFCLNLGLLLHASEVGESSANPNTGITLMEVTGQSIHINCWTDEEFASRIGTTESELNKYIGDLFQEALEEVKIKNENTSVYFLKLAHYDVSASGYPYNNFQHSIEYGIYDDQMNEIFSDKHRFVTFSNVSKNELVKQFKKVSKKIVSTINKK